MYIALCGIDGSGKSTALHAVSDWLSQNQPREIVRTREPGGTPTAEAIRNLLQHSGLPLADKERMLLLTAARHSVLNEVVIPALAEEKHVISDRCHLSTETYQATTPELLALFRQLHANITTPDIIILLDVPAEDAFERMDSSTLDDMETKGVVFQAGARERYLEAAKTNPFIIVASSSGTEAETYQNVIEGLVGAFLKLAPLSIMITNEVLTYNGRNGQTDLPVDVVYEKLMGYGYMFTQESDGTWNVKLGYNSIGSNLLHENQVIKIALSDAMQRGYWNGIINNSTDSGESAT